MCVENRNALNIRKHLLEKREGEDGGLGEYSWEVGKMCLSLTLVQSRKMVTVAPVW